MYTPRTKFQATVAEVKHKGSRTASSDVEAPSSAMSQLGTMCRLKVVGLKEVVQRQEMSKPLHLPCLN